MLHSKCQLRQFLLNFMRIPLLFTPIQLKRKCYSWCQRFFGSNVTVYVPFYKSFALLVSRYSLSRAWHSSRLTCSPASRASHVLVAHVPRVLHALVPHVTHTLRALMPHAPHALRAFVHHLSWTIGALVPFVCLIPNVLFLTFSCISCLIALVSLTSFGFDISDTWVFFLNWTTVNHYVMRLLLKQSYYNGLFLTWYKPPGSLNLRWPHRINPLTHICQESKMTCLLNATSIHYIFTIPTQIH